MKAVFFSLLCIGITMPLSLFTKQKPELTIGDQAPDFTLVDEHGTQHTLHELRGKKIALYFYPKDNTPGCTQQACNIRDNFDSLQDAGITTIGLSKGSSKSKNKFETKHHLPFLLLIATKDVLKAYGAQGSWFTFWLPKRITFLINENGVIVGIIKKVDVNNHAQQILDGFRNSIL